MTRHRGLTLIELIVALAVFSVLGLLSYRAIAQISEHRQRIGDELERWREISRCMVRIETALLQVVAPPGGPEGAPPGLQLLRLPGVDNELQLVVGDGARHKLTRVAFRFGGGRLDWTRWPDRTPDEVPESDTLLDRVVAVRWHFMLNGRYSEAWPLDNTHGNLLPQAVELEMELADAGTLTRLVALR